MFLKKLSTYYVCVYWPDIPDNDLPLYTFSAPASDITGTITQFVPFFKNFPADETNYFYVSISNGVNSGIFQYDLPLNPEIAMTATLIGNLLLLI